MRSLRYSIRPLRNSASMVPPSMVVSRETDFGVEGGSTSRPSRPRARSANRNAQSCCLEDFHLQAHERPAIIGIQALGAGEVEVKIVERSGFDGGRVGFEDAAHAFGKVGVVLVLAGDDDGLRANAQRFAEAHRGFHAKRFCFIACRSDAAASDQHGLATQPGIQHLLDRSEKRVHVHVDEVGDLAGRRLAEPEPGPGGTGIFLRSRFGLRRLRYGPVGKTCRAVALRYSPRPSTTTARGLLVLSPARWGAEGPAVLLLRGRNALLHALDGGGEDYAFDTGVHDSS